MKTVKNCMTTEVVTLKKSTPLSKIIQIIKDSNLHTYPVVEEDNRLVGIVTIEDVLAIFQPYSSDLAQMLKAIPFLEEAHEQDLLSIDISSEMGTLVIADDFMSTQYFTIEPDASISDAYSMMKLHKTNKLMVVEQEKLVGIISMLDIILDLFREKGIIQ